LTNPGEPIRVETATTVYPERATLSLSDTDPAGPFNSKSSGQRCNVGGQGRK
jgi:hypothetical protein